MDEYKWNADDYQNNETHSMYSSDPNEPIPTQPEKKGKKKRILNKTVKLPTLIMAVILSVAVGAFAYAGAVYGINGLNPQYNGITDGNSQNETGEKPDSEKGDQSIISNNGRYPLTIPEIAKKVGPTVVGVVNKVAYSGMQHYGIYGYMPQDSGTTVETGSGSGVIISEDGYVVTNNHVIEGATEVYVITNTGDEYKAVLKGTDARTDLAVLKIEGKFPYATLGNSSDLEVGELAVAIGNPLGQEFAGTVTDGIISALNRSVTIDNKQLTLLQTNAAINPGNSGGPLVNQYGEVVGINTAKISSDKLEGLGFAIPVDEAKPVIKDLIENGYVRGRPVIGVGGRNITEREAEAYGLKVGIYVASMSPESPAYMAGIKINDIIVEADGQKVTTIDELNDIKNKHAVGDKLELKVYRNGSYKNIILILGEEIPG